MSVYNRYRRSGVALLLALLLMGSLFSALQAAPANTPRYVASGGADTGNCADANAPCATIGYAVEQADEGDTVRVMEGIYAENVTTQKSVTIEGDYGPGFVRHGVRDPTRTVINANGTGRPMTVRGATTVVWLDGLRFTGGNATTAAYNPTIARWGGGILVTEGATLYGQDLQLDNNVASADARTGFGGGMALANGTAMLTNVVVINNTASPAGSGQGRGGGIYVAGLSGVQDSRALFSLTGGLVQDNVAVASANGGDAFGGGIMVGESDNTHITINDTVFLNNVARAGSAPAGSGDGGGLAVVTLLQTATVTVTNSSFISNTANASSNTMAAHSAKGGGLFFDTNAVVAGHNIIAMLNDVTVTDNVARASAGSATGQGGGIYAAETEVYIQGGLLVGNIAAVNGAAEGGGIRMSGGPLQTNRLTVLDNLARPIGAGGGGSATGGGLHVSGAGSDVRLVNSIFADNFADSEGRQMHINFSGVGLNEVGEIIHVTVASAEPVAGQAIYYSGSAGDRLYITNTVVSGHNVGIINSGATGTVTAHHVLYYNNTSNTVGSVIGNVGNVEGNPQFVNPLLGDYHIGPNSAALNVGADAGITDDVDGDTRPQGPGFDIGADERLVAPPATSTPTPTGTPSSPTSTPTTTPSDPTSTPTTTLSDPTSTPTTTPSSPTSTPTTTPSGDTPTPTPTVEPGGVKVYVPIILKVQP